MKIITKKGAQKISKELSKNIKIIFLSKGIKLKENEILKIENSFLKSLGGRKNERKN